ncbi:MAG: PEGA domain-containing protein [Polyangiaceae bacterium]|nr:PEGA domain-containing protein [Polyangiaceae bacterium]
MTGRLRLGCALLAISIGCAEGEKRPDTTIHSDAISIVQAQAPGALPDAVRRGRPVLDRGADGFALATATESPSPAFRSLGNTIDVRMPTAASGSFVVSLSEGTSLAIRRRGLGAIDGRIERDLLVYDDGASGVASVVYGKDSGFEELFVVREMTGNLGYDVDLPAGWRFAGAEDDAYVLLLDDGGRAKMRVRADRAWDRDGDLVRIALRVDERGIAIDVAPGFDLPLVIDPTWADASAPIKLRRSHTSTLLSTGEVLVLGGYAVGTPDPDGELYDPRTGTSEIVKGVGFPRTRHTATMLLDGRVLVAGGVDTFGLELDETEIFDPAGRTSAAGPLMSEGRADHVATSLDDGSVLFVAPYSTAAEVFDPSTNTFSAVTSPSLSFTFVTAALLADGRVLYVGSDVDGFAQAQVYDPADGAFTQVAAPPDIQPAASTLTRLRDGRVLLAGGCPCFSIGGPDVTHPTTYLFNPTNATWSTAGDLVNPRTGHTATLLPTGEVLVTGGNDVDTAPEPKSAEVFDPTTNQWSLVAGNMNAARGSHTATLLPTGDVLLIGGNQAAAELYVAGTAGAAVTTVQPNMGRARADHTATKLLDGRVLIAGGDSDGNNSPDAELYDPSSGTFAPVDDPMVGARSRHTATLLEDGRVLLAGGAISFNGTATAEIFDPATSSFTQVGDLTSVRADATATLLGDGRVLVAGGRDAYSTLANPLGTADLFDPVTDTFTAAPVMPYIMERHAAALLPNGQVLLVGRYQAQIFDPGSNTFAATTSPGTSRLEPEIVVLPNGTVLVTGGGTIASEIFDPSTATFSFSGDSAATARNHHQLTLLPTGQALLTGGQTEAVSQQVLSLAEIYDPLFGNIGGFVAVDSIGPAAGHTATVLDSGSVLVTGGYPCRTPCAEVPQPTASLFVPATNAVAWRPVLTEAPASAVGGTTVTIIGSGLRGPEASGGATNASASNYPIGLWQSDLHGTVVEGTIEEFTDGSATWTVPATSYTGSGRLRVVVNGVLSNALPVSVEPAVSAAPCTFGADCASGFCADGVCCNEACDGSCDGCTAARKGSGADGVCGDVPPELDPDDACVLSEGAPCEGNDQCATGFCVDGVCCQSACTQQCEACDKEGSVGVCVPVTGAPHGDRPACAEEAPADPCDMPVCDGADRTQCAETVGPCDPFACGPEACLTACETDDECATGFHCDEGACVAGQCDGSLATTPDGEVVDCSPYTCQPDGSCRTSCADVSDCTDPFACNFEGRCVARPPADEPSSCDCKMASRSGRGDTTWILSFFAVAAIAIRRRRFAAGLSAALAAIGLFSPKPAEAQPKDVKGPEKPSAAASDTPTSPPADDSAKEEARRRFEKGLGFVASKSWAPALAEFLESRRLHPTRAATQNAAFSLRQLGRADEALEMYETLLREYPDVDEEKKKEATQAITDLRAMVGTIEVDSAEPGATIVIDGRVRDTYPATAPLRVAAGNHVVRVFKKGYEPFETRIDVAGRGVARVEAKLVQLKESGTLRIEEQSGKTLTVIVDQVEVGKTPFEGQLAVGKHVVTLRGDEGLGVPPTSAPIERDRTTSLELAAVRLDASLRVEPAPAAALVTINSVPVGRGTWEGPLPAGKHRIEIAADGFLTARREIVLDKDSPSVLNIPLDRDEDDDRWKIPGKITLEASGSLNLFPSYFGGTSNGCDDACSSGVGLGGLALLHGAYEFGIGVGIGISGGYITTSHSVESRSSSVQPVGLPSRDGRIDDRVTVLAGMVGAHVHYHFGQVVPVLLRLGAGAMIGETHDERTGRFELDDGFTYQAGPVVQKPFSASVYVDPEVRVAYPITESFEVSLGVQALVVIALVRPQWDARREVDAAVDGIGAFGGEDLTGPAWFLIAPGVGARYAF